MFQIGRIQKGKLGLHFSEIKPIGLLHIFSVPPVKYFDGYSATPLQIVHFRQLGNEPRHFIFVLLGSYLFNSTPK
jgi:hypothetical protein